MAEEEGPYTSMQFAIDSAKVLFACSPLIALFYVIYSGFETPEEEAKKKKKRLDFELSGHAE
eukprot:CAMPEP_0116025870 /NCGR_PEP_ID=MMETSP0321-20121206/13400_1 /TAXON_ID=163516 /ORGANISM="Leptocylindrus danicus var. danicus, Strain B650" /LENGTH=61 /DNA_ID=CAMNT_0003498335 /DNA_START=68 /DNA_END=253 /DNA_ORIENTATION=+